jgi:ornithine lipid hydroxylase
VSARDSLTSRISVSLFPLALLLSLGSLILAWQLGWNAEGVLTLTGVATLLVASWLERGMPWRADWNRSRDDAATDWTSLLTLVALADPFARWLVPILAVAVYQALDRPVWTGLSQLPFIVQVLLVTLLAELGKYGSHRWHHTNARLWWLHALHHGSERLYALNNFRFHPLNHVINHLMGLGPVMLLGASPDALLVYLALSQPVLMLQHANLPLRQGFLNRIFSTNEAHRVHHSTSRSEGDSNFGRALLLWDHVFGTYRHPSATDARRQVGMYQPSHYPARASYPRQLASMFGRNCCPA